MNNSQFRNLANQGPQSSSPTKAENGGKFGKPMLGSKSRSSIPMTPRALAGRAPKDVFARQVTQFERESHDEPPTKRFKATAAPKGTVLPPGYIDRTKTYNDDNTNVNGDSKAKRLKALEEMLKLQQIDQHTFEKLRDEIGVGGDVSSTHLVKGLDRKLLERVRRGEDVTTSPIPATRDLEKRVNSTEDVDDELEKVLEKDTIPQAKVNQKRSKAPDADLELDTQALQSFSRDEILRRLKSNRKNAKQGLNLDTLSNPVVETSDSVLGARFKKIAESEKPGRKKYTEIVNGRRREVLEIIDKETGKVKRKTRWLDPEPNASDRRKGEVMGMELPEAIVARRRVLDEERKKAEEEEQDGDIFADAGEYDPLAGMDSDASGSEEQNVDERLEENKHINKQQSQSTASSSLTSAIPSKSRDYFSTSSKDDGANDSSVTPSINQDASIIAAIKRAAQIRQRQEEAAPNDVGNEDDLNPEGLAKRSAFLAKLKERDRQDAMDLDMGFGDSRLGDGDDEEEEGGRLAEWKGTALKDDDEEEDAGGYAKKNASAGKKRKPKKRKGDKNSFNDVMSVLESRRKNA